MHVGSEANGVAPPSARSRAATGPRHALIPALIASLALASGALAAPPDRIERLAAACNGCHGVDGTGSGAIPALAGRDVETLVERLESWRTAVPDGRDHLMVRFARGLTTGDLRPLAEHYAQRAPDRDATP